MRRSRAFIKRKAEPDILREIAPRRVEIAWSAGKVLPETEGSPVPEREPAPWIGRRPGRERQCCLCYFDANYFLAAGAAGPALPEPLKYLKKSEFESTTITSP